MKSRRASAALTLLCIGLASIATLSAGCSNSSVRVGLGRPIDPPAQDDEHKSAGLTIQGSHNTVSGSVGAGSTKSHGVSGSHRSTVRTGAGSGGGGGRPR